jgi:putative transposase
MESWRKNYLEGRRRARRPRARRIFAKVKKMLLRLEGDVLRISVRPREFIYIDLSRRYFKLGAIEEPIITLDMIYLPVHVVEDTSDTTPIARAVGWDFNVGTLDGFSPETGWIRIDTTALAKVHEGMKGKRRRVQGKVKGERTKRRLLGKYRERERNRAKNHQVKIAKAIRGLGEVNGFEGLDKRGMLTRSHPWNRRIADTDWRGIAARVSVGGGAVEVDPRLTSRTCSRCG